MEDAIYNEDDNICETPCEKGYYFVEAPTDPGNGGGKDKNPEV